eukprot:g52054.t1
MHVCPRSVLYMMCGSYRSGQACSGETSDDTQKACSACGWASCQTNYVPTGQQCNGTGFTDTETCSYSPPTEDMSPGIIAIIVVASGLIGLCLAACSYAALQEKRNRMNEKVGGVTRRDKETREGVYSTQPPVHIQSQSALPAVRQQGTQAMIPETERKMSTTFWVPENKQKQEEEAETEMPGYVI